MRICSKCKTEKPLSRFRVDRRYDRLMAQCKDCINVVQKTWRTSNPEYERMKYQQVKRETRERHLLRKYKINLLDYQNMLTAQNGLCAICYAPEKQQFKKVFHVDHCHETGDVRGLLCRGCNHMLGAVSDDTATLQRAIDYLELSRSSRRK